jgi:hypothetical protein
MFSPPLSDSEGSVRNARVALHDRRRPYFVLRHNAHISDRFAKATNVVEKKSFLAPRLKRFCTYDRSPNTRRQAAVPSSFFVLQHVQSFRLGGASDWDKIAIA